MEHIEVPVLVDLETTFFLLAKKGTALLWTKMIPREHERTCRKWIFSGSKPRGPRKHMLLHTISDIYNASGRTAATVPEYK